MDRVMEGLTELADFLASRHKEDPGGKHLQSVKRAEIAIERLTLVASTPPAPLSSETGDRKARYVLEDCADYIDSLHRQYKIGPLSLGIDTAKVRAVAASLMPAQPLPVQEAVEPCPDCGRPKAKTVEDVKNGDCPKWWAIRDAKGENAE